MLSVLKQSRWLLAILTLLLTTYAFGHGMSEAEKQIIIDGGNLGYIWIGASHMLSGYDHLMFVFGIIFFLTRFKDIVKYVTAFTLGHSVTLIYATFNAIQVNYFLIDAVIALSVCYIAFTNLDGFKKYLNIKPPNMLAMITGLGLIHGLGLSTRLQQLPLNQDQLLMNIISFNLGIELGQVSALAFMLLLLAAYRKRHSFKAFSLIINYALVFAGGLLFVMQMHGYQHSSNPEEFAYSSPQSAKVAEDDSQLIGEGSKNEPLWRDTISVNIPARGEIEYKLELKQNDTFDYLWDSGGAELFFDFHGEPKGDTTGYFESFKKDSDSKSTGVLTATFEGTHGWYWRNYNSFPVEVILKVKGSYQRLDLDKVPRLTKPVQAEISNTHDTLL